MSTVLVTGGTGKLGRAVVERLQARQREIRVLSRTPGAGRVVGDLRTGAGLGEAVEGVDVVVHCATTYGRNDVVAARRLVDAIGRTGGAPHLVNTSIAGVDRIPLPYYRAKLAAEQVISGSGLPWTNLRATQFHDLLATIFDVQRWLPVTFAPDRFRFQPIDLETVADHLAELAIHPPVGNAPDLGGPRIHSLRELAEIHRSVVHRRRPILSPRLPGRVAQGYAQGWNLVPDNPRGTLTFEGFLRARVTR
ncbi:SDR family oxidoreductase [Nocardia cyriacigeorgica]|uniref:SDR family oxidoreductase n=1 Tax=Nocardia cyriacigeorgica TaxID=135487 RepID=UPI0018950575|nr:NAD(P)H-binding protein [Nocardia cyriacigeorgica]MBF6436982.1 NAD(P)H-binding protein [Nocardia cyriacigeorgica]